MDDEPRSTFHMRHVREVVPVPVGPSEEDEKRIESGGIAQGIFMAVIFAIVFQFGGGLIAVVSGNEWAKGFAVGYGLWWPMAFVSFWMFLKISQE